jgi:hypothetical protein
VTLRDTRTVLEALLALTPEVPPVAEDPAVVVERAEAMFIRRAAYLADLEVPEGTVLPLGDHAALHAELVARTQSWAAAVERARHQLAYRLQAGTRVARAYGP